MIDLHCEAQAVEVNEVRLVTSRSLTSAVAALSDAATPPEATPGKEHYLLRPRGNLMDLSIVLSMCNAQL